MYARKQKTGRRTGFLCMAGVAGLEPTNGGIKTRCLTNLAIPQFFISCPMWRTRALIFLIFVIAVSDSHLLQQNFAKQKAI